MESYEISGGSVIGRDHLRLNKNNQDAYSFISFPDRIVAVVCDGCGSGAYSEVGARIATAILPHAIRLVINPFDLFNSQMTGVIELNSYISGIASDMYFKDDYVGVIRDHFLFTCVVAVITNDYVAIGSVGDGVYALNDEVKNIGPFPGNAPPYSSYGIVPNAVERKFRKPRFSIHEIISTNNFHSLMIGSDGVEDLLASEEKNVPGKDELIGPLKQFWTEDKYFSNKMALQRRLVRINKEVVKVENGVATRHLGHLRDDTTMVVIRRK
jgi:hypothetical protein